MGITDASVRVCITDHEAWQLRYDDLKNYNNERSLYLAQLRDSIEGPWQAWELSQIDVDALKALSLDEVRCGSCLIPAPWQAWELSQVDADALKALSLDEVHCGLCALACGMEV